MKRPSLSTAVSAILQFDFRLCDRLEALEPFVTVATQCVAVWGKNITKATFLDIERARNRTTYPGSGMHVCICRRLKNGVLMMYGPNLISLGAVDKMISPTVLWADNGGVAARGGVAKHLSPTQRKLYRLLY